MPPVHVGTDESFRDKPEYKQAVRDGFCPECGRSELVRRPGSVLFECLNCHAHFTREELHT